MFIKTNQLNEPHQYPYNQSQIRRDNPHVSFPYGDIPVDVLEEYGVFPVIPTEKPVGDVVTEGQPELINGVWAQTWETRSYTPEEVLAQVPGLAQKYLDDFARTRNYEGILSACTYATSTFPRFQAEGQYCVNMRDVVWGVLYEMLEEVLAGERPVPTIAEALAELPTLEWPA